jgi:aspartyl-tRNA(Asn)/glutamyl-tRNA(Gln) amidotransferase subunit C
MWPVAIDRAEVRRIAQLAHLELDDAVVDALSLELESILDHVALLDELEVAAVDPPPCLPLEFSPLRQDEPQPSLPNAQALKNAPDAAQGHFRVPKVLDG